MLHDIQYFYYFSLSQFYQLTYSRLMIRTMYTLWSFLIPWRVQSCHKVFLRNIKYKEEFFSTYQLFFLHTRSVQVLSSICTSILNFVAFFVVSQLFFPSKINIRYRKSFRFDEQCQFCIKKKINRFSLHQFHLLLACSSNN